MKNNVEVLDIPLFIQKRAKERELEKLQNYIYKNIIKSQKAKKKKKVQKIKTVIENIALLTGLFALHLMFYYMLINKLFAFGYLRIN